jgi:hypothetical protein
MAAAIRLNEQHSCSFDHLVGAQQELTWTTQRQITLTSTFQNAITTLTLGFPPSSVSSCTVTRITTLGFFARAFAHSRSIISAFSTSVSKRCMNILRDKWPRSRRAAEQRDELATSHSITSSAVASSDGGTSRPSAIHDQSFVAAPRTSCERSCSLLRTGWVQCVVRNHTRCPHHVENPRREAE